MASVPVTELLQRVEDAADMENFVTQEVMLRWLNVIHPRFRKKLAEYGWAPIVASYEITADGSTSYTPVDGDDVPLEMMAIFGVWRVDEGEFVKLKCVDFMTKPSERASFNAGYFKVQTLEAGGVSISLFPVASEGTYIVDYLPVPSVLVTGTPDDGEADSVNYPAGWEEWLVLQLVRKCYAREETSNPSIEKEFTEVEKEIERMCRDRIVGTAVIRNVDARFDDIFDSSEWIWI